jgi:TonB-linked SusC/RagA family outer membrane protein
MRQLILTAFLCLSVLALSAQVRKITGKVTSEDGAPLAGVSIMIKGKTAGTQTDGTGSFSIEAATGDVLSFSFTNYVLQEVTVGSVDDISVSLKPSTDKMTEVVVVGYGTQSRRNVTNAISKLDNQVLASAPRSNLGSAFQGTLPGLQVVNATGRPGATPYLLLRGGASINNPGSPLVVIDGVIRSFADIPSDDIASVELLKDAAATAIYGARANNGVMLITTKQGKQGKADITYRYAHGWNKMRDDYNYLGAKDYISLNRQGNLNSGRTLAQVNSSNGYGIRTDAAYVATFDIKQYNPNTAGLLQQGWDTVGDPYGGTIIFKNHGGEVSDLVFRNTNTNEHYISASGGNDRGRYFSSFNYYDEEGIIVGSSYRRYAGTLNGSYKISPNVEVSSGVIMSTSSEYGVNGSEANSMYRNLAIWPTFNPWIDSAKTNPNPGNGINDGNPLYWLSKQTRRNEVIRVSPNVSLKWDIIKGLYVKASANGNLTEETYEGFTKATQNFTQMLGVPSNPGNTTRPAYLLMGRSWQKQFNAFINYSTSIAEKHNFNAMFGGEYFDNSYLETQVSGTLAPTDDIPTVNASTVFAPGANYSTRSQFRIASLFGRLNYDFDKRFLVSLVFRNDGVSSLAEENRWGFFPGMSAGWNVHNEKFFTNSNISKYISTFKPRVSYGENGNVAGLGRYEVQGTYGSQGLYNGSAGFLNTGIINPGLQWEKSKTFDIGFDLGLLNNRVTILFDYFDRKTSDLLTNLALPSYTGFGSIRTNNGTYQNKGYEFGISANLLNQPNGFKIDLGVNAGYVENKILELPFNGNERNRQGGLQVFDPNTGKVVWVGGLQEGGRLGDIYAFKQVSIFANDGEIQKTAPTRKDLIAGISGPSTTFGTGKITPGDVNWLDVDKNDTIDSRDQVYVGNIYPKWTGGFTLNVSYKGFSLFTRFDFAVGHTIYNDLVTRVLGNYQGTFNYIDWQKNAWSPTNTNTDIPKVYYADQVAAPLGKKNYTRSNNASPNLNSNNSRFYEKGDYLACREITFSYDFSKNILAKTRGVLENARIYLNMNNLFYMTKFSGPTPEPPLSGGTISGVYVGTFPTPKSIVLGVQVTF